MEKAVRQRGSDIITPIELAQACNMTHNSINRLLLKLEEGGYAKVVGKQPSPKAGRPSRLIRLKLGFPE
jgi:predicted ArsR family transcriptional regulator